MPYLVAFLLAVIVAQSVAIVALWRKTQRTALGLEEISEDALKALYHLSREKPVVRESDLIRAADLRPGRAGRGHTQSAVSPFA